MSEQPKPFSADEELVMRTATAAFAKKESIEYSCDGPWNSVYRLFATLDAERARAAEAVMAEREACAKVAESAPNLEGPPPEMFKHIVLELRLTVAATKHSIASAIRARSKE